MSRPVTILVFDGKEGWDGKALLHHLQATAGIPCKVEIVPLSAGIAGLNKAMQKYAADDIVWASSEIQIATGGWLQRFRDHFCETPALGLVGAKIYTSQGLIYSCGRSIVSPFGMHEHIANIGHGESDTPAYLRYAQVDAVLPWLCYIRREALDAVGGLDALFDSVPKNAQQNLPIESDDFCMSVRSRGFSIYVDPSISATHSSALISPKLQALYNAARLSPLDLIDPRIANLWRKKWRWHPAHPNLVAIREKWLETPVCWRIGHDLLDQWDKPEPLVDVVIVTRNNLELLRRTMASLAKTTYASIRVWVHLNGSTDESKSYLEGFKSDFSFPIYLDASPVNIGHAPAVNWLFQITDAPLIAKLDDDIELEPGWLTQLVSDLRDFPYAGAIGAKVVNMETPDIIQWADYRTWPKINNHQNEKDDGQFNHLSLTVGNMGCCLLYRRKAIAKAEPYDIALNPASWDDLDHQIGLWKAGYQVLFEGRVTIKHPYKPLRDQCRRAVGNTLGNGYKVAAKRGPGAMQALDESLDDGSRLLAPVSRA
jgi:GT2 family glycosyltransferase